jgi:hypothetical protein
MNKLNFSFNWNNKLDCKCFTTLRLRNPNKYFLNAEFEVFLKDEFKGKVIVTEIRHIKMHDINEFIARLDTGYSKDECKNILQRMYKNADWTNQDISFILLTKI